MLELEVSAEVSLDPICPVPDGHELGQGLVDTGVAARGATGGRVSGDGEETVRVGR